MSRRRDDGRARDALAQIETPDEHRAEERARRVVAEAFATREAGPAPSRRIALRGAAVLAAAGLIAGLALTPAGADVREWIADRVKLGEEQAEPRIGSLPAPGNVLVEAPSGAWLVRDDGSRRRLGAYDHASWSPQGRFVAVATGSELRAVDAVGDFRWSIESPKRIDAVDWSEDEGFRVAYLAGDQIRVVAGDGTGDRFLLGPARGVRPVWRPETDDTHAVHQLTYVDGSNRVALIDADTEEVLWRTEPYSRPIHSLEWSEDGERLLVAAGDFATLGDARGNALLKGPVATGVESAAISPAGDAVAVVSASPGGDELALVSASGRSKRLYSTGKESAKARFGPPVFSPDGEWILLPWPEADQWLFVNVDDRRVTAVADITRQFDSDDKGDGGFPEVAGWCC